MKRTASKLGYDPRKRSWWKTNRGDSYWTYPYVYSDLTKMAETSALVVRNETGGLQGIFTSDFVIAVIDPRIKTRVVSTYLTSIPTGKTGISMAVNKVDGSVVGVSWAESLVIFDASNTPRIKRVEDLTAHRSILSTLNGGSEG